MAAKLLLKILDNPATAPNSKTNPFTPIEDRGDNVTTQFNPYGATGTVQQFNPLKGWQEFMDTLKGSFENHKDFNKPERSRERQTEGRAGRRVRNKVS